MFVGRMSLCAHLVQGHEEFDDEITLAGSGRVTPFDEVQHQLEHAADSPEGTATGPASSHEASGELPQQAAPEDHQWRVLLHWTHTPNLLGIITYSKLCMTYIYSRLAWLLSVLMLGYTSKLAAAVGQGMEEGLCSSVLAVVLFACTVTNLLILVLNTRCVQE